MLDESSLRFTLCSIGGILSFFATWVWVRKSKAPPPVIYTDYEHIENQRYWDNEAKRKPPEPIAAPAVILEKKSKIKKLPHILVYGHPGLGKTTFIEVVYKELKKKYGSNIKMITRIAGQITGSKDVEDLVKEIHEGDFVFIDEIASLKLTTEELFYSVLQDFTYYPKDDSIIIDGASLAVSRTTGQPVRVPECTICGATTAPGKVSQPMRDRFPITIELDRMSVDDLVNVAMSRNAVKQDASFDNYFGQNRARQIIQMHINGLDKEVKEISPAAARVIAERSLGVTRITNDYRFHAEARAAELNNTIVELEDAEYALDLLGIDANGTTPLERRTFKYLLSRDNHPVGMKALAAVAGCSVSDVENIIIPRMSAADLMTKDHRNWNVLTQKAIDYYGKTK